MMPDSPDITALGAPLSPGQPVLRRVCAIRADIAAPLEFATSHGPGRSMFPIFGGAALGAGWRAAIQPGGADFARLLPDGSYEIEARYILQLDDGTLVMVTNAGRMFAQPDGSFHGRTRAVLEVPKGPHQSLADMVLFGTAFAPSDDPDHVYIELWHAII
jgi:hypothetical protein